MQYMLNLAQMAATGPFIATGDSGVSWGALIAILTALIVAGSAALGFVYRNLSAQLTEIKSGIASLSTEQSDLRERIVARDAVDEYKATLEKKAS